MEENLSKPTLKKEYFYNIDFFRFLFIMAIALSHTKILLKTYDTPIFKYITENIRYSHYSVELFFIIGGFFLFYTMNLKYDFYQFVKHKLIRLMPVLLFGLLLFYVLSWFTPLKVSRYDNIWALFLLQNIGITHHYASVGASWFVSCLFWVSSLFFYAYKNLKKELFNIILAIIVILCASCLANDRTIATINNYNRIFNAGVLRAIMSMGIGYFLWNIYCDKLIKIKNITIKLFPKLLITALEGYLTVFILQNVLFKSSTYNNYLILPLLFSVLFVLLLIKQGYISKFLNNRFSQFLGKYVYSLMLTHETIRTVILKMFNPAHKHFMVNHPVLYLVMVFGSYIIVGILTYYLVEKPATIYLKNRFEKA